MTNFPRLIDLGTGISRRRFIAGVAASGALAACSGSDGGASSGVAGPSGEGFTLVQRFPNNVLVPGEIRMPITLSTGAAEFIQDGPVTLGARVVDIDGNPIGGAFTAVKRTVAPAPYYDFRTTINTPGVYALVVDGGPDTGAAFQVLEPSAVAVPTPGQLLPSFDTPTIGDEQGLAALCTRAPEPCPFHTVSLADALTMGKPVAYYVGTPAFCSTGSCAPALDALVASSELFGDKIIYVHAEVFTDDAGIDIAPAVTAIGMTYEPALFLTDASGVVVERLDAVWDSTELNARLTLLTS
ncbi:hypothetical protein [Ilumatobacter sp.]|uniref:hypothetical protein n=1 Tax=Ilumatobacter sp. TaxID=1967498 RepID=UPI003751B85C